MLLPYSVSGLTVGEHTFAVSAVDNANNVDPTPATYTWTDPDGLAPETTHRLWPSWWTGGHDH